MSYVSRIMQYQIVNSVNGIRIENNEASDQIVSKTRELEIKSSK